MLTFVMKDGKKLVYYGTRESLKKLIEDLKDKYISYEWSCGGFQLFGKSNKKGTV